MGDLVWHKEGTDLPELAAWKLGVVLDIKPKLGTAARPGSPDDNYDFQLAPLGHTW